MVLAMTITDGLRFVLEKENWWVSGGGECLSKTVTRFHPLTNWHFDAGLVDDDDTCWLISF